MSDKYYYKIGKSTISSNKLLEVVHGTSPWIDYDEFKLKQVPLTMLDSDSFIKWLCENYEIGFAILKIRANSCYPWHTDNSRLTAVNMLLTPDVHSHTLFNTTHTSGNYTCGIQELVYEPDTLYAFNTTIPHTVFNFEADRYLLSSEFMGKDMKISHEQLIKDIKTKYKGNV